MIKIVDDPTEDGIKRILECLTLRPCQAMRLANADEIARFRGTPGEPIPKYEVEMVLVMRFYDDNTMEGQSLFVTPWQQVQMAQGKTVFLREYPSVPSRPYHEESSS